MWWQVLELAILLGIGIWFLVAIKRVLTRLHIVLQGPFYAATTPARIEDVLKIVKLKPNYKVADLGSGDGRILIAFAKKGIASDGYEIDDKYIDLSRENIRRMGLEDKATIINHSFWEADLSTYDVIVTYCIKHSMAKLERKLLKGIKPTAQVISVFFQFPNWQPTAQRGDIRLYRKPR